MIYYHDHPEYRIGDEIQTTALIKYLNLKGHDVYYKDSNPFVSAIELFPDNLVVFASANHFDYPIFEPYNMWYWNPMLRNMGIWTDLKDHYQEDKADLDVVFIPVLNSGYNTERDITPKSAADTFHLLLRRHSKVCMVIDTRKRHILDIDHPNVIYSNDIYETFNYVRRSKIFVGMDTGTSHFAGAIKHPRMILAMPDEKPLAIHNWQRELIAERCSEPEILKMEYNSLPCCDPKQYQCFYIKNNQMPLRKMVRAIDALNF